MTNGTQSALGGHVQSTPTTDQGVRRRSGELLIAAAAGSRF
jgi:hypothetical protein